ncbi:hypothetical protein Bbelb_210080 [Branchiostoma belcheri]|nr:hypothetical protein Bbelb_210080 [Branchiostoma belcheri]
MIAVCKSMPVDYPDCYRWSAGLELDIRRVYGEAGRADPASGSINFPLAWLSAGPSAPPGRVTREAPDLSGLDKEAGVWNTGKTAGLDVTILRNNFILHDK